jgi:hypothetical protein
LRPAGGTQEHLKTEPLRAFDRARSYYSMLMLPADEVLKVAGEKPLRYSGSEWLALLQVRALGGRGGGGRGGAAGC